MSFYLILFIISNCTAYAYSKSKIKDVSVSLHLLLFCVLFIPSAIRYGVGADYFEYRKMVDTAIRTNNYAGFEPGEPGWIPILYFMDICSLDTQWFFIITSFFSLLIICNIFEKKDTWLAILGYTLLVYNQSYNIVRQTFAITILMISLKYFINKKNVIGFLWLLIACLFHKSLYVILILFPFILITKSKKMLYNFWILLGLSIFILRFNGATILMEQIVPKTGYSGYATGTMNAAQTGSGLGVLLKLFISSAPLLYIHYRGKPNIILMEEHRIVCVLSFFQAITYLFSSQIIAMHRLPTMFLTCEIFMLHDLYNISSKYRKLIFYTVVILLVLLYLLEIKINPGGLNIGWNVPYDTVFGK